jgi:hypothetical protein
MPCPGRGSPAGADGSVHRAGTTAPSFGAGTSLTWSQPVRRRGWPRCQASRRCSGPSVSTSRQQPTVRRNGASCSGFGHTLQRHVLSILTPISVFGSSGRGKSVDGDYWGTLPGARGARRLPHRDKGPARRVLRDRAREVLRDTVPRVCAGFGAVMKEMNGEDDPAHLLVGPPPTVQLSRLVSSPKGVSSLLRQHDFSEVRRRRSGRHRWSPAASPPPAAPRSTS